MPVLQPIPRDDRTATQRYNASAKGKARRKQYRHDNSKWITDAQYLSVPIVGVDGEGITRADGSHDYIMLAISGKQPLRNPNNTALTTEQILRFLWRNLEPDHINVIYGGGYDFNMWLKGLPKDLLHSVYKGGFLGPGILIHGFRVKWMRGKSFSITYRKRTVTVYDTIAFFQCSFIQACDDVLKTYDGRDVLVQMKAARGSFTPDQADAMSAYNNLEVDLLVRLISVLREHLNAAKLRPRRWYGPGALATALLSREHIKLARADCPPPVAQAARYAYAGGRFEQFKYGHVDTPVWEYDINSAYPAAIMKLPDLARGVWEHHSADPGDKPFALYRVTVETDDPRAPGAVFYRSPRGAIFYPPTVTNWVWSPEIAAIRGYLAKYDGRMEVHECWEFVRDPDAKLPFEFVGTLYAKRQNAKVAGEGVQIAYKLALNSLYGKLAQQVGWVAATAQHPAKIPPFHQLEWAGFVTSYARGLILQAITQDRDAVIAVETDAVFATHPLDLPCNDGLGAWKEDRFADMTYVQSGHYYATTTDGKRVVKCRGIDKGFVSRETVDGLLAGTPPYVWRPDAPTLPAALTRFIGAGVALSQNMARWCRWETAPRALALFPNGKREHVPFICDACLNGDTGLVWHDTACTIAGGDSSEYPIAWINPNADMSDLEELREAEQYYDD